MEQFVIGFTIIGTIDQLEIAFVSEITEIEISGSKDLGKAIEFDKSLAYATVKLLEKKGHDIDFNVYSLKEAKNINQWYSTREKLPEHGQVCMFTTSFEPKEFKIGVFSLESLENNYIKTHIGDFIEIHQSNFKKNNAGKPVLEFLPRHIFNLNIDKDYNNQELFYWKSLK